MKNKQEPKALLTDENIDQVLLEHGSGFSEEQIKNIHSILKSVMSVLSGLHGSNNSGGGFSHMFFQRKDGTWLGFHNDSGDVTVSKKFKTFLHLYKAFWEDSDSVTGTYLRYFTDGNGGGVQDDFSGVSEIVKDILENNTKKIMAKGGKIREGKFDIKQPITSKADVESFFMHLLKEEGVSFHPDDDFIDYVNHETGEPTYTHEEAELRNRRMDEAFAVMEGQTPDIYEVGIECTYKFDPAFKKMMEGEQGENVISCTPISYETLSKDNWEMGGYAKTNCVLGGRKWSVQEFGNTKKEAREKLLENVTSSGENTVKYVDELKQGGTLNLKNVVKQGKQYLLDAAHDISKDVKKIVKGAKELMREHYANGGAMAPGFTIYSDQDIKIGQPYRDQLEDLMFGTPFYHVRQIVTPASDQWFDVVNQHGQVLAHSLSPAKIIEFLTKELQMAKGGGISNADEIWLLVNGDGPVTYEDFIKANTGPGTEDLPQVVIDRIKNLTIGEVYHDPGAWAMNIKRVQKPIGEEYSVWEIPRSGKPIKLYTGTKIGAKKFANKHNITMPKDGRGLETWDANVSEQEIINYHKSYSVATDQQYASGGSLSAHDKNKQIALDVLVETTHKKLSQSDVNKLFDAAFIVENKFEPGGALNLNPAQEKLLDDFVEIFKPEVKKIEAMPATTQNHYGNYMALLSAMKKPANVTKFIAIALMRAGANVAGVKSALQIMYGEFAHGGGLGLHRYAAEEVNGEFQIKDIDSKALVKAKFIDAGLPRPPYATKSEAESVAFAMNQSLAREMQNWGADGGKPDDFSKEKGGQIALGKIGAMVSEFPTTGPGRLIKYRVYEYEDKFIIMAATAGYPESAAGAKKYATKTLADTAAQKLAERNSEKNIINKPSSLHDALFGSHTNGHPVEYWINYYNESSGVGPNVLTRRFLKLVAEEKEKEAFEMYDSFQDARDKYVVSTVIEYATGEPIKYWKEFTNNSVSNTNEFAELAGKGHFRKAFYGFGDKLTELRGVFWGLKKSDESDKVQKIISEIFLQKGLLEIWAAKNLGNWD